MREERERGERVSTKNGIIPEKRRERKRKKIRVGEAGGCPVIDLVVHAHNHNYIRRSTYYILVLLPGERRGYF